MMAEPSQMYPTPNSGVICQNRPNDPRFGLMINKYKNEHPQCMFEDLSPRRSFYVIHPDWTSEQNSARFMELGRRRQAAHLADQRPYHFYHPVNADVERLLALRRKREMERDGAYQAMHTSSQAYCTTCGPSTLYKKRANISCPQANADGVYHIYHGTLLSSTGATPSYYEIHPEFQSEHGRAYHLPTYISRVRKAPCQTASIYFKMLRFEH